VATAGGIFLAISPIATAGSAIIFLIVALLTRYVSLGSIMAAASMPLFLRFLTGQPFWIIIFSIIIAVIIIVKHRRNIYRIAQGEERKFPQ
jgi:glycerol-3-phosphate acyltransferase PlsY